MSIAERIDEALRLYGLVLPSQVRQILRDIGNELTEIRAELEKIKKQV